ncbi:hypothetical protein ADUPG1_010499, partial [Aduncisulcus paluster]
MQPLSVAPHYIRHPRNPLYIKVDSASYQVYGVKFNDRDFKFRYYFGAVLGPMLVVFRCYNNDTIPIISFVVKSIRYDTPAECVSVQNASDKISSSLNPPKLPVVEKEAPKGKPPSTKDLDELIELSESESDRHTKKTTEIWEIDDVDSGHPQQSSKPANPIQISTQNPPNVDNLSSFKTIPAPPSSSID